mgnify:CR=1 FL=1
MDRVHIKATMDVADERAIQHCMQMLSDCISLACGELDDLTAADAVEQAREAIKEVGPALTRFARANRPTKGKRS